MLSGPGPGTNSARKSRARVSSLRHPMSLACSSRDVGLCPVSDRIRVSGSSPMHASSALERADCRDSKSWSRMGVSLPSGVWVGVGSSGTGEMVGVSVGAAVGFAVAVGVDVAIGSGVGPEQAARVAMSIRMIGVAWMIVRSTGGVSFFVESTLHSTRLSSQSFRQFLFFAPLLGCSGRRNYPPLGRLRGTWPTSGNS